MIANLSLVHCDGPDEPVMQHVSGLSSDRQLNT